jgi:prepilin-type N-terminal cleavage/methylation domain-containing protein
MHKNDRRQAGLTLVEMLIAVALLGIVLLGIAPLFIASVRSNYAGNEYTSIHNLARDRLEQLMNLPVNDPQLTVGVGHAALDDQESDPAVLRGDALPEHRGRPRHRVHADQRRRGRALRVQAHRRDRELGQWRNGSWHRRAHGARHRIPEEPGSRQQRELT